MIRDFTVSQGINLYFINPVKFMCIATWGLDLSIVRGARSGFTLKIKLIYKFP
jgi:hypothetical protein